MSSKFFLFEGDFKRRPNQTLGGSSRGAVDKDALLRKADEERKRRERERKETAALIKLQAFFRGCRVRKDTFTELRGEFDGAKKGMTGEKKEELFVQMQRLNVFFQMRVPYDTLRLLEIGKVMLANIPLVTERMMKDPVVAYSVKMILYKCVRSLHATAPFAVLLRLMETYTDISKYGGGGGNDEETEGRAVILVSSIWLFLVVRGDFFLRYRQFLEGKIPPMRDESEVNRITESYEYLTMYKRVLNLKAELVMRGRTDIKIDLGRRSYDVNTAMDLIMHKFAQSFAKDVIPLEAGSGGGVGNNGVAAYYILPRLCEYVPWEEWVKTVPFFKFTPSSPKPVTSWRGGVNGIARENNEREVEAAGKMRQIFYVTLIFMRNMNLNSDNVPTFLRALNELRPSIDPRCAVVPEMFPLTSGLSRHLESIRDDEEDEDMDVEEEYEHQDGSGGGGGGRQRLSSEYLQEFHLIYTALKTVVNQAEVAAWLTPFRIEKWNLINEIISCVVRLEPFMSSIDFTYLSSMSYKRDFMRGLCHYALESPTLTEDNILAFCWFFSHLTGTLHDAEFLNGLPITKDDLGRLIVNFRELFCSRVLKDGDWGSSVSSSFSGRGGHAVSALSAVTGVLMRLYERNTRMNLFPEDMFISSTLSKICPVETHSLKFDHLTTDRPPFDISPMEDKLLNILKGFPFALPFHDRVKIWNRLLDLDKQTNSDGFPLSNRPDIQIRRKYIYEDAFEKLSPENVPDLRKHIRISLVNVVGVMEAGIDGGGLLREFLTESTKAAVDPNRGLFRFDSQNRLYPNPVAKVLMADFRKHYYSVGRLVGKALYEQTLLELPIAAFFIQYCIEGKVLSAVDFLATLDPALHKNLLVLKKFEGDWSSIGLDFTVTVDELGETRTVDLKKDGRDICVDETNVIEYIHLISDYKINKEMEEECRNFRAGMLDVVPTLRIFSWKELQTLISGSDKPIDIEDWRAHTNYGDTYNDNHPTVVIFWQVVKTLDERTLRMLLKFVTSCSRPPLLGFKDLVPKFGIHSAGQTDRLPTASTCMNLLKLPEFTDFDIMKDKLLYVISAHAGFELS